MLTVQIYTRSKKNQNKWKKTKIYAKIENRENWTEIHIFYKLKLIYGYYNTKLIYEYNMHLKLNKCNIFNDSNAWTNHRIWKCLSSHLNAIKIKNMDNKLKQKNLKNWRHLVDHLYKISLWLCVCVCFIFLCLSLHKIAKASSRIFETIFNFLKTIYFYVNS